MSDFPLGLMGSAPTDNCISSVDPRQPCGMSGANLQGGNSIWPTASLAIYLPIEISVFCTITALLIQVSVASGNLDVGIYDETGAKLVSSGSTVVGAAGIQNVNIADTALKPGVYFAAMAVDNITASFIRLSITQDMGRSVGCQQQATAFPLPATATFAAFTQAYLPLISLITQSGGVG